MGLGRTIPQMTVQKGGDRFNQTFSTWWLSPVVLSHCSEHPWESSGFSCASQAVLFSAAANTHISSSFSPRAFYPALTLKRWIKTWAAFSWDCTDTAKDVSCFGESWVQLEVTCTCPMMNSWRILLLFPPFCLTMESLGTHQAQLEYPKSIFCCAGATRWYWSEEIPAVGNQAPSSQHPDIPIWSLSCLLLYTSLDILHNQLHISPGMVPGSSWSARRQIRLRLSLSLPGLGWRGAGLEQPVTQHSSCCSLFRQSSPSHTAPLLIPVFFFLLAGEQCLGKLWWPFRTQLAPHKLKNETIPSTNFLPRFNSVSCSLKRVNFYSYNGSFVSWVFT